MRRAHAEPSAAPESDVITAAEVAALLRMTPAWVYAETRSNRIPHMRLGRYFRYRRSAIEVWMDTIEEGPHPKMRGPASSVRAPALFPAREPSRPGRITGR